MKKWTRQIEKKIKDLTQKKSVTTLNVNELAAPNKKKITVSHVTIWYLQETYPKKTEEINIKYENKK